MTKELQDHVWPILPKEFRKEVKKMYESTQLTGLQPFEDVERADRYAEAMCAIFGEDNLISDAEGDDEMLTVSRKQIDALQGEIFKAIMDAHDADDWQDAAHYILDVMPRSFAALFGSKCLSDEDAHEDNFAKSEPKPAEPKEEVAEHFDTIVKSDFRNERRLNIATKIVASMVGSDDWTTWRGGSNKEIWHNMAKSSLEITDALISECNKGDKE